MASVAKKCTTHQQRNKQSVAGKSKKLLAQSHSYQIPALKANNRQLATALDELRQDYRRLQQENLQLKQERQNLLEKVASLEKTARRNSFSELLKEAQSKLREVQSSLDNVLKTSQESPQCKQSGQSSSSSSSRKVLRFSSPTKSTRCTIYPRTPHPLHNMTCVVDGPQLSSTPVKRGTPSGPCLQLHYSDSSGGSSSSSAGKEPLSAVTEPGSDKRDTASQTKALDFISPIEELMQREEDVPVIMTQNSTLDQLEDALAGGSNVSMNTTTRPRRKCAPLSLSYQEPSLKCKLRRGDAFTEQATEWNHPDTKDRRKTTSRKSNILAQRKILREVQNQL